MFCPTCGMKIEGRKFCPYCGTSLAEPEEAAEALQEAAAQEPVPAPQPEYQPQPQWEQPQPEPQPEMAQPVRFDTTNTYQYNQTYTPENPYVGQPQQPDNEKKGGKKPLLWIILGAAALLLVAGVVVLLLSLKNCGSAKASGKHLFITTQDGGVYIDNEKGVLFEKADQRGIAKDYSAAVVWLNNKIYYVKDGEKTRIGGSDTAMVKWDTEALSWILYQDKKSGDIYMFRPGKTEDVLIIEDTDVWNIVTSQSKKYISFLAYLKNKSQVLLINTASGEVKTVYEGKQSVIVRAVDDAGCLYYQEADGSCRVTDGQDDVELGDADGMLALKDVLLLAEKGKKDSYKYYTRPFGMKGEMKALDETIDQDILDETMTTSTVHFLYSSSTFYGYTWGEARGSENVDGITNTLLVEYEGDLYLMDLLEGKCEMLLENTALYDLGYLFFSEDMKTAYAGINPTLFKLTYGRDGWEKERLTKKYSIITKYDEKGLVYVDDGMITVYDGKNKTEMAEFEEQKFDLSEDMRSIAYGDGNKVMYIGKTGEKAERLARDYNGTSTIAMVKGAVYYINDDGDLARVVPGKDPEVVMEDVKSFYLITK